MTHINHVHVFVWDHRYLTTDWQTLHDMAWMMKKRMCIERYDKLHVFSLLHKNSMT